MDYQGNSKKDKEIIPAKPKKNIERVTTSEVLVKKKSVGNKFKEVFVAADFRGVLIHVIADVLIPAAKNMVYDVGSETLKRTMFGERASQMQRFSPGPRTTYNNPIKRG